MSSNKGLISAAHHVNNALLPAEASTAGAAIASAQLLLTMLREHQESGAAPTIGLLAIGYAKQAASLAVEAREAHIRAHGALNIDLKRVGLERMYGKGEELPTGPEGDEDVKRRGTIFPYGAAELPAV